MLVEMSRPAARLCRPITATNPSAPAAITHGVGTLSCCAMMAPTTPPMTALMTATTKGDETITVLNMLVPGATPLVRSMPWRSSLLLMTVKGSTSGASCKYAWRMRFIPITHSVS